MRTTDASLPAQRGHARRFWLCAGSLLALSGTALAIPPDVRVVDHQAGGGGNGQSWATAYRSVQDALADAQSNSTVRQIWVAAGTYKPTEDTGPGARSESFKMISNVELYGGFAGGETTLEQRDFETNVTILSGGLAQNTRSFHVVVADGTNTSAILDGFTVTGGEATDESPLGPRGGGIHITAGSAMAIRNCIIRNNSAYIDGPGPFENARGGGVYSTPATTFSKTWIRNNSTIGSGGGVYGGGTFDECALTNNSAFFDGGGFAGSGTFDNCLFEKNSASTAGSGGGAVNGQGTFTSCDFIENSAPFNAGAISGSGLFIDCNFLGNSADTGVLSFGSFTLIDCHFEGNYGQQTGFYMASINAVRTTFKDNDIFRECTINAEHCLFSDFYDPFDPLFGHAGGVRLVNSVVRHNTTRGIASGSVEIINSSIINNWIAPHPAVSASHPSALVRIHNSIFWNNGPPTQETQISVPSGTVDVQYSCIQGWTGSLGGPGNFGFDPHFADSDGRLSPGSPCIDAGNNTLLPAGLTKDLDGLLRFHDDPGTPNNGVGPAPIIDMGAFEFQGQTCYANCDQSTRHPILNIDDFTCFIDRYARGHPLANCTGNTTPPILTIDDFVCFIDRFTAGCP